MPKINDSHKAKTSPVHVGIDTEILAFEISYVGDAASHGIKFKKPVTMGFSEIKWKKGKGTVVGLCTYGKNFREIDIDPKYWAESSWETKRTLIYHEMTHCLCGRYHTWKDGTYPEADSDMELMRDMGPKPFYKRPPGFLDDECAASIMYPYVLSDECIAKHWPYYDSEMFEGCKPY